LRHRATYPYRAYTKYWSIAQAHTTLLRHTQSNERALNRVHTSAMWHVVTGKQQVC